MYYKILAYLKANAKTVDDFQHITLQDEGQGVYISRWEVPGLVEPTVQDLDAFESQALTEQINATFKRIELEIANRIDMICPAALLATLTTVEMAILNLDDLKDKKTVLEDHVQTLNSEELDVLDIVDDSHWV